MSTRAQIRFATREAGQSFIQHPDAIHAQFYKHSDGYPEGLGLDIAGVDLLFQNGGYKICEVNSNPGFEGMENFTKKNIAGEIVSFIKLKLG